MTISFMFNKEKNVYEGIISGVAEPIKVTGKILENPLAVKKYEEIEKDE